MWILPNPKENLTGTITVVAVKALILGQLLRDKYMRFVVLWFSVLTVLGGCGHVTIQPDSNSPVRDKQVVATVHDSSPSYTGKRNYYWLGLVGEHHVNVKEICSSKRVLQMQSMRSFSDASYALLSLGIYTPMTVKVWCES